MSSYYKYTNGESFTLNGFDYSGFFTLSSGMPYTGRILSSDSKPLSSKNTFMSECFLRAYDFNTTYQNEKNIKEFYIKNFDIINKNKIEELFNNLSENNLKLFSNLLLTRPTIFNKNECNLKYYAVDYYDNDAVPLLSAYNDLRVVKPFKQTENFTFLRDSYSEDFIVNSKNDFQYYACDDIGLYVMEGNFENLGNMVLKNIINHDPFYNNINRLIVREEEKILIAIDNESISIFDISNFGECYEPILIDKIKLTIPPTYTLHKWNELKNLKWSTFNYKYNKRYSVNNPNHWEFIKFGKKYRLQITNPASKKLEIYLKYSQDFVKYIDLSSTITGTILANAIRDVDDLVCVFWKDETDCYVTFLEPDDALNTIKTHKIYGIDANKKKYGMKFIYEDSDIISLQTEDQYQYRYISNPKYPAGKLEDMDFYFIEKFKWNTLFDYYNNIPVPWGYNNLNENGLNDFKFSILFKNNKMYGILKNDGRIYTMYQGIDQRLLGLTQKDLIKNYQNVDINDCSIGLMFNSAISFVLKDFFDLLNKTSSIPEFSPDGFNQISPEDIQIIKNNYRINGNEGINIISLQRILQNIYNQQRKLLPK